MKVKVGYDIYSSGSEFKKHFRYIIHLSKVGTYEVGSPLYNIFIPIADQLKELQGVKVDKMRVENHKNSKRKTLNIKNKI